MRDLSDFVKPIRKIVLAAIDARRLTRLVYGTVETTNPLTIRVDQKKLIDTKQLQLTRAVMDYETEIRINDGTKQPCTIYNALKVGDRVTMVQQEGGQTYLIIDKEVAP